MNSSLRHIEAARWNKLGRRWSIILGTLLTVNLSLVAVAVRGYTQNRQGAVNPVAEVPEADTAEDCLLVENPVEQQPTSSESAPPTVAEAAVAELTVVETAPLETSEPAAVVDAVPAGVSGDASPLPVVAVATPEPAVEPAREPLVVQVNPVLVIVNPRLTGGSVHFLVDDAVVSLEPGEFQWIAGDAARQVVFHPGDTFEDVELTLTSGVYVFEVSSEGWQLTESCDEVESVLKTCRPANAP